ncbi:MAG: helix-turn-helix transcriptional regulator [bacterium]
MQKKIFGQYIRELRASKDLSLRELGSKIGKTAAFLSDIELGNRFPAEDVLPLLAEALGVTAEDLQQYDQRPPVREMQELVRSNPQYGFAFRKVVGAVQEKHISPDDLVKRVEKENSKCKEKEG